VSPTARFVPQVAVLYFPSCANYARTRRLVESTAADLGIDVRIELIEVKDEEDAVAQRFLGSPTVRVDGHDVEPAADERRDFAFSCRLYRSDGGVLEAPDPQWIRGALTAAAA
jgi:hypothetical protein